MVCTPLVNGAGVGVGMVCGPAQVYRRYYGTCEVCQRRRRMVRRYDGMHYGYTEGCYSCGTFWMDGIADSQPDPNRAAQWWYEAIPPREFDADIRRHERTYFD